MVIEGLVIRLITTRHGMGWMREFVLGLDYFHPSPMIIEGIAELLDKPKSENFGKIEVEDGLVKFRPSPMIVEGIAEFLEHPKFENFGKIEVEDEVVSRRM